MTTLTTNGAYRAASANVLTTELNALANNGNTVASSAFDNSSNLDLYASFNLNPINTQGSARAAGAALLLFAVHSLDGTNYDDVNENVAEYVGAFPLDAAVTLRRNTIRDWACPPGLFKFFGRNATGQALAATGTIIQVRFRSILNT